VLRFFVAAAAAVLVVNVSPATASAAQSVGGGGVIRADPGPGLPGQGMFNLGASTRTPLVDGQGGFHVNLPGTAIGNGVIECLTVIGNRAYGAGRLNDPVGTPPFQFEQVFFIIEDNGNGKGAEDRAYVGNAIVPGPPQLACEVALLYTSSLRPVVRAHYEVNP